jgi:hypothetical protein
MKFFVLFHADPVSFELVYTATSDWLGIAEKQGLEVDYNSDPIDSDEWDAACAVSTVLDPNDSEGGFATLVDPRDCDTLLRAGDIVVTSGPGGDVAFLRRNG